jgi:hypothetical protein
VQDDVEEPALLMAEVCALSDSTLEMPTARVVLDERRAVANLGREGDEDAERWFLDTGASNHMTGNRAAFTELDTNVTGSVKFGDNSAVSTEGRVGHTPRVLMQGRRKSRRRTPTRSPLYSY